jgi:AraC-like DNA-binding protein/ligand-binding sensor protein
MIKEFSVFKEKNEIKRLFQQIIKVLTFTPEDEKSLESLVSIRYLLRKQFFIQYCALVRSASEGLRRCVCPVSDITLIEHVKRTHKPCFTYCHAGLVDFAFPLTTSESSIVLAGGQFLFEPLSKKKQECLLDKVSDLPLPREELRKQSKSIPIIPLTTIKSIIALITTIPEHFPERDVIEILSKLSGHSSPKHEKIKKVISFLKSHYRDQHSLQEIASEVGLSPYYLAHIFPQELGLSVMQYRTQLRMAVAKEMLKNTKVSITRIAYDLGWNDSNYFSLVFRKETGQSPRSFRQSFHA